MTGLRELLKAPGIVLAPGIYDGLSALLVEQEGFKAAYLSGASLCYTRYALPDIGLVSMNEVADTLGAIRERATLPIIVDIDTGFGNALNVQRTIREFERRGASGLQMEDQVTPKRCGHLKDKVLIPAGEMVQKIKAALDARTNSEMILIARTDAIAVEGFEAALERAERYVEAGADLLFVEAPENEKQMAEITRRIGSRVPVMANMVEGGKTPVLPAQKLAEIGFKLAIFPGGTVRALAFLLREYYAQLNATGTTDSFRPRMLDFTGLNKLLGTETFLSQGRRYDPGTST